jgi:hypothetical protein
MPTGIHAPNSFINKPMTIISSSVCEDIHQAAIKMGGRIDHDMSLEQAAEIFESSVAVWDGRASVALQVLAMLSANELCSLPSSIRIEEEGIDEGVKLAAWASLLAECIAGFGQG